MIADTDETTRNREVMAAFGTAWLAKDVDALMALVTDDCVYAASVGPEPGTTFRGREVVRAGFEQLLAYDAQAENRGGESFVAGDRGFAAWEYLYTDPATGATRSVRGCDRFEFRDGKIAVKDAFRKTFDHKDGS